MIAVRLTPDVEMLAVASPDYLARNGEPKTPADLHRHLCINWRFPGSGNIYRWQLEKKGKRIELSVEGALISNHQDVVRLSPPANFRVSFSGMNFVARAHHLRESRLPRSSKIRPIRMAGESATCTCLSRAHSASLDWTASNVARSRIGSCSPA